MFYLKSKASQRVAANLVRFFIVDHAIGSKRLTTTTQVITWSAWHLAAGQKS